MPKITKSRPVVPVNKKPQKLTLLDVKCTICLEILIHPVKLPCKHELCKSCFEKNCELTSFQCPLCRTRLSSWARKAKRKGSLVDTVLWEAIQKAFPNEVRKRMMSDEDTESSSDDSEDSDSMEESDTSRSMASSSYCQPGEIKTEFDEMLKKFNEEKEQERLREEKASEEFIKKLLQQEATSSTNESSHSSFKPTNPKRARYEVDPSLPSCSSTCSTKPRSSSVDSSDSITQELSHFKPINAAPLTPPKKLPDGQILKPDVILSKARRLNYDDENAQQENTRIRDIVREKLNKDSDSSTAKQEDIYPLRENSNFIKTGVKNAGTGKKSSKMGKNALDFKTTTSGKDFCSKACQSDLDNIDTSEESSNLQKVEQEKADFQLALQLQAKFNKLSQIPLKIDRRKGSGNEYNLRIKTSKTTRALK